MWISDSESTGRILELRRFRPEGLAIAVCFSLFLATGILLPFIGFGGWITGYLLGFGAVASHLLMVFSMEGLPWQRFLLRYYVGLLIRFLLVLSLFILLLLATNIEQISFTLSFIISYIFHSVVDVILIHKTSTNSST